jgi:hypothetical protein
MRGFGRAIPLLQCRNQAAVAKGASTMTKTLHTPQVLTEDDFLVRFKPAPNHIDPNAGFDGCMFETFGEELAHVKAQDRDRVWTILDCDGQLFIESGFHSVNRLGYLVASVPTESDHTYSVACVADD